MSSIDRTGTLGADKVSGLANFALMKADPVWDQLAGEIAKLQAANAELQAKHNLLVAQLVTNGEAGVSTNTHGCVAPLPNL